MKLVSGSGAEGHGACWMSALHYYTRKRKSHWSDEAPNACVDPLIRSLCITLNDACDSDEEREEMIGPRLFSPIGTAMGCKLTKQRMLRVLEWCIANQMPEVGKVNTRTGLKELAANATDEQRRDSPWLFLAVDTFIDRAPIVDKVQQTDSAFTWIVEEQEMRKLAFELIDELCAMGERREVVPTCPKEEVLKLGDPQPTPQAAT